MKMFRKLVSIVAAATLLTSSMALSASVSAAQVDPTSAVSSEPQTQDNVNNGVILHAFNWSYNSIKANLPQIKAAGYSAVQTSPVTQPKDFGPWSDVAGQWPKLYQPVSMSIAQKSWLGTKSELSALCAEADKYGIKIVVDIVANHMANYKDPTSGTINKNKLSDEVKTYEPTIYNSYGTYFHSETYDASDSDAYTMTRGHVSDCPDLNTGSSAVQGKVLNLLKECIDCGVDGFRFDAAKHIETESDGSAYSNFWAQTLDQAKSYYKGKTGKELFAYGEILNTLSGRNVGAYTKRMRVTENKYSDNILAGVNNGSTTQASSTNYQLAGSANTAVVWAESHDTNMGSSGSAGLKTTSGVSDEKIVKAWAILAARQGSVPLFFARPGTASMGEAASDLTYKSTAVSEVNKFHNAFASVSAEKVGVSGSFVYVARGNSGVVLSNINGNATNASVTGTGLADGDYIDTITGNAFKVSGGTLTGRVGDTGVAVVYHSTATPKATASVESGDFTTDTLTVQLGLENAVKGSYALENYAPTEFTGSPYIRIGSDYKVGETITLNLTAVDAAGNTSKSTYVYNKKAPTSSGIYVYLNPNIAKGWSNIKCYIYDEDTKNKSITYDNGGWSGTLMKFDSKLNYYYVDVPIRCTQHVKSTGVASESDFDLAHSSNTYVIFNGVKNNLMTQYPGDGATQAMKLKLGGQSHVLDAANTSSWKVTSMTPSQEQVQAVDVKKGGQVVDETTTEPSSGTTAPPEPVTKFVKLGVFGDVDGNGKVDVNDITTIQRHVAEFAPLLEGDAKILADVDKDGDITIKDVTYIQMYLAEYPKAKTASVGEDYGEIREVDPNGEKFSVTATSNFFAKNTVQFDAESTTVLTVAYSLNCNKDLLGTDWILTYDNTVLQPQGKTYMPDVPGAVYNTKPESASGGITGNFSSIRLASLSNGGNPIGFVSVTFKVLKAKDTTVDLNVRDLLGSTLSAGETTSKAANEVEIVENSHVKKPDATKYQGYTSVYAGSYDASRNVTTDPKVEYNTVDPDPTTGPEPITDEPPTGTRTILFTDNKGWGSVNIHFWGSSQQADTEWPGVAMTPAGMNGYNEPQFSYEIPVDVQGMVFNGPGGQTVNVDYDNTVTGWYPIDTTDELGHYNVDSWIDDNPYNPDKPDNPDKPSGTRTIEFTDNQGWGTAYIYVYGPDGAENAAWPGVLMNKKGDNGYGGTNYWYELPTNCDLFIFNNGNGDQTVDITDDGVSTGWYPLDQRDDAGHLQVGSWVDESGGGTGGGGGDLTITFSNNKGWGSPKIHYFGGSSESTWPGVGMTSIGNNDYGEEQFQASIPSDSTGIVINDNGGAQTIDITLDGAVNFYLTDQNGEGKWNVGTWGDNNGGGGGGTASGDYYLVGYINGADVSGTDYAFNNGSITMTFTEESYVCIRDAAGNWFMANGFPGMGVTSTTLYSTSITGEKSDKLWAPADTVTFTLVAGSDGTFQLSEGEGGDNPYIPDNPDQPSGDTRTIKFTDNQGWGTVYCYWWNDNGDNAWPGTQMSPAGTNDYQQAQFSVDIPTSVTHLIFSNGNGTQTVDLDYNSTCTGWYPTTQTDGKWNCDTWTDGGSGGDDPNPSNPSNTITITFSNNKGWGTPKIHYFGGSSQSQWPGDTMQSIGYNDYGEQQFQATIPGDTTGIVFNDNGGTQTVDITLSGAVNFYLTTQGGDGKWNVGTW